MAATAVLGCTAGIERADARGELASARGAAWNSVIPQGLLLLTLAFLAMSRAAQAQADYSLEPSPPLASLHLPAALANRLHEQGSRLVRTAGGAHDPICDVWWVKATPAAQPPSTGAGILYGKLRKGAVVGVLRFLNADAEDSRDQKLKPGGYTMRYAQVLPGNEETGSAEYRDFLLLIPVAEDRQVTTALSDAEMTRLSIVATGTRLPALLSLVPPNPAYKRLPAVVADDVGNCSLQVSLRDEAGSEFSLSLLLVTPLKEEGGS
jgi:hypothetical protein